MERPAAKPSAMQVEPPALRAIWQVPALIGAGLLLAAALTTAVLTAPQPDFDRLLEGAAAQIDREHYDEALGTLNKEALPYLEHPEFTPEHRRNFHVLRARAIFHGQHAIGVDKDENHQSVVGEYLEAERRGAHLSPRDTHLLAKSLIALGHLDRALERADHLPDSAHDRRIDIIREVILAKTGSAQPDAQGALALLADLLADPRLDADQQAWALSQQAQLLLEEGYADEAIAKLLRSMARLASDASPGAMGELCLLMGRAYLEIGAVEDAIKHLERSLSLFHPGEATRAEALVLLASADERQGRLEDARDRYASVIESYGTDPAVLPAMLGQARTMASLDQHDLARQTYQTLADTFKAGFVHHPDMDVDLIGDSLLAQFADRYSTGSFDGALEYALLAERLYSIDAAPDDLVRALADANRRLGEERLGQLGTGLDRVLQLASLDPTAREQARRHFIAAGSYYSIFANRVTIRDNDAYADALWHAADCFDAGGDRDMAIQGFQRYATEIPNDARQAEARFRLAQAFQSRGDYDEAAKIYKELIETGDDRAGGRGVGPYAHASFVPLAQAYLADADAENDAEAQSLLQRITSGTMGTTDASYFREGLITLARLYYQSGRYVEAIEHLEDATARYPTDDRVASLTYLLADSYRLEADAISQSLLDAMPDHEHHALEDQRRSHLRRALELYDLSRGAIEGKDPRRLTGVEKAYMRNAYFYIGACAFDLGDYDAAIAHYNTARERFPQEPSSLVAMIQIVHAHMQQGQIQSARTANERARRFYASLPPDAWDDPMLPMRRADWERWLDLTDSLERRADAGD